MAHTTVNSGLFISGTHVLTPFDGSVNHGHQFRGVAPEIETEEKEPENADGLRPSGDNGRTATGRTNARNRQRRSTSSVS